MATEKIDVTQRPASEADIAAFIRGEGNEWSDGSQYQAVPQGAIGSGPQRDLERLQEFSTPQPPPQPLTQERLYESSPPQEVQGGQNWQVLYGQSENEKGKWRRTAEEAMAALEQAKAELNAIQSLRTAPNPYATSGYVQAGYQPSPNPAYVGYGQAPATASAPAPQDINSMLPATFFPGKDPETIPEVKEVDAVLRNVLAPAVLQLWQQQQQLQFQQVAASKAQVGITPVVEQRLYQTHPWLQNVPDGPPRVAAMQDVLRAAGQTPATAAATPQVQQAVQNPTQAAARRVTYIESGSRTPASPQGMEGDINAVIAREYGAAKTAAEKKAVLMKYGMMQVNDFGPGVLTR